MPANHRGACGLAGKLPLTPKAGIAVSVFSLLVYLLCAGCSSSRVFQTSGSATHIGAIRDVQVALANTQANSAVEAAYNYNSMSGAIRQALIDALSKKGQIADSGDLMEITVTDFRLRSGVAVFWIGVMAGDDYLAAKVTVRRGGVILKSFDASAKSSDSAWSAMATGRVTSNSRADLFCRMIAKRIVKEL